MRPRAFSVLERVVFFAKPIDDKMRLCRVVTGMVRLDVRNAADAAGEGNEITAANRISCTSPNAMF